MLELHHGGHTTCSRKSRLCLKEKGLAYTSHFLNLRGFDQHAPNYVALNPNGVNGGVMQMINHGIYSAALFLLVGVIYERRHTRNVSEFGGLSHVMPGYAAIFLGMVMTAIGLPLLAVFISEFLALRAAFEANPYWAAWAALGIILNAGYFLWLYQRMFFGTIDNPKNEKLTDLSGREWAYMVPLMILALWIGVYPKPFL